MSQDDVFRDTVKITFTGDIMCDMEEIPAYKEGKGYDFSDIFRGCRAYFASSDYVVGNLETPIANAEYSCELYKFNSPLEFAQAVKNGGFSMVTTANNHCLDRGVSGLEDTNNVLDTFGLKHTGTNNRDVMPTGIIEEIGTIRIGFLSYTYGTNAWLNHHYLGKDEKWKVNLYQEQELHNPLCRCFYDFPLCVFFRKTVNFLSVLIRGGEVFCPVWERNETGRRRFCRRMNDDIRALKKAGADYIVMCLHAGGQYNPKPLGKTKKLVKQITDMGADAVIVNHEHVIHPTAFPSGKIIAYSLGNFSSRNGINKPPYDRMAEYSLLLNIYLPDSKSAAKTKPIKQTFTIVKTISTGENRVKSVILYDLIKNCSDESKRDQLLADNLKIYNLVRNTGETEIGLKAEYPFGD
jgi:poly-gamma-glutamate synthesis protein (capsule biosynthesis protein)